MEVQGNILKTLLIAAVVYTLALGAPVKRQTSSSIVAEACEAAKDTENLCSNADKTSCDINLPSNYDEAHAAEYLSAELKNHSFNGAVSEAVWACLNDSAANSQKCQLAAAAIILQDTIKAFFERNNETQAIQIDCDTSTDREKVVKTLCYASVFTREVLANIDNGKPYGTMCWSAKFCKN